MSTYAIGDIQGCFDELLRLLTLINFDETSDTLWFTGDLINRGKQSLETLRFIQALGEHHVTVLGNHDLHALGVHEGFINTADGDTLEPLLQAPDCDVLMAWLRKRPLCHTDHEWVLVHAGVHPTWTLEELLSLNDEVQHALQTTPHEFFKHLYGNHPTQWDESLTGLDRLRCITNYLTRLRFCKIDGEMDFISKQSPGHQAAGLVPWFTLPRRITQPILFGHWASLHGKTSDAKSIALDTGCVWGHSLTALRLEDRQLFQVQCGMRA